MSDFTDAEVILRGTSRGTRESRNERGQVVSHSVQLVKRNSKNGIEVMQVRLPEGADPANYADGKPVEISVDVSTYEGTIYFRAKPQVNLRPADNRSTDASRKPSAPMT
ncbi:hypothetical protein [Rhodopseudomonas parapalustris]